MVQSPELTGGAGFTFEDTAVAIYLGALLAEEGAPGLIEPVITRVAVQQAAFGQPLDDLIIEGRAVDLSISHLSLQVKRELIISAAISNVDFREIVLRAWATLSQPGFLEGRDRVGVVTGTVSESARRALNEVCECARVSLSKENFLARFDASGFMGEQRKEIFATFRTILAGSDSQVDDADVYRLLRHFVLIRLDVLHEGATDDANAIARLRHLLPLQDAHRANDLWNRLRTTARDAQGRAGEFSRQSLLEKLGGAFRFRETNRQDREGPDLSGPKSHEATRKSFNIPDPLLQKRMAAADRLWSAVVNLKEKFSLPIFFYSILMPSEYDSALEAHSRTNDLIVSVTDELIAESMSETNQVESDRPYLGNTLWSLFFIYRAFLGRLAVLIVMGKRCLHIGNWRDDNAVQQILRGALGEHELKELLGNPQDPNAVHRVLERLQSLILREITRILSGT